MYADINNLLFIEVEAAYENNYYSFDILYRAKHFKQLYHNMTDNDESLLKINSIHSTFPNSFTHMYLFDVIECNQDAIKIVAAASVGPFATRVEFSFTGEYNA